MIDLHQHLLPSIDDGSSSIEISREMMALARQLGYTRIVATPHLDGALSAHYESKVKSALAEVKQIALQYELEIELGYEIMLTPDLPARLVAGERSRLAGSTTVLVELPFTQWPLYTDQTLFDIQAMGLRTLLAHPERYHAIQTDPGKALELAERGILMQVTIGSFAGLFGKPAQKIAELLLKEGAATVLATDAHGAG
ncbi:MAG: CpsB/CapC family capsule biosynthesis tyrosine phosphatase, partial [Verrucomicrobiales bacterium]